MKVYYSQIIIPKNNFTYLETNAPLPTKHKLGQGRRQWEALENIT